MGIARRAKPKSQDSGPRILPIPRACRRAPFNKRGLFSRGITGGFHPRLVWIYREIVEGGVGPVAGA
ncbi:hypothetical protein FJP69_07175 [Stenotrophomonas maltophilia]|nr:hypothetical protein FJP69_07175 [Stenotrophomonas maltophilia]